MKKLTSAFLMLVIVISTAIPALAFFRNESINVQTTGTISGVFYGNTLKSIEKQSDLDASLSINSLILSGSNISFSATAHYAGEQLNITSVGNLYKSVVTENTVVGLFDSGEDFTIESFVIELSPQPELLLKTTTNMIQKTAEVVPIIKIAVTINATEDVIYFEDTINNLSLLTSSRIANLPVAEENSPLEDALYRNERWFFFFASKDFSPLEASSEDVTNMNTILNLLTTNEQHIQLSLSQAKTESPIQPIDASLFKREGISQMTTHDVHGWYMNTVEYPVGSGNFMSSLTKWSFISPTAVSKNNLNTFNLKVMASGEYFYRAADDVIEQWTSYATYRIGDAKVAASLKTERGDIFTYYQYTQQYNSNNYTSSVVQILGLFKRTAVLGTVLSILEDLTPNQITVNADSFYDTLAMCEEEYGLEDGQPKAVVYLGIATPNNKKLYQVDDRILMSAIWKKPSDAADYYTYNNGSKTIEIAYKYSVYAGSTAVLSEKTKVHTRTYS